MGALLTCRRCSEVLSVPQAGPGARVSCPRCGAPVEADPQALVELEFDLSVPKSELLIPAAAAGSPERETAAPAATVPAEPRAAPPPARPIPVARLAPPPLPPVTEVYPLPAKPNAVLRWLVSLTALGAAFVAGALTWQLLNRPAAPTASAIGAGATRRPGGATSGGADRSPRRPSRSPSPPGP